MFGFVLRKTGRRQASTLCWVRSLQDCTLFLAPAWTAQQHERTSESNRGCGEGTETSSPGKSARGNAPLLLGKTLFYTDDHFLWVRVHVFYLLLLSLFISAELNQAMGSYLWYQTTNLPQGAHLDPCFSSAIPDLQYFPLMLLSFNLIQGLQACDFSQNKNCITA